MDLPTTPWRHFWNPLFICRRTKPSHLLRTGAKQHVIQGLVTWKRVRFSSREIIGGDDTPYAKGVFKLEIHISERYPFEPPKMTFLTPIYHPNIDDGGRICLDTLKMPPKGAWKPCLNISTVLTSIQLLMAEPNPEDPLMTDISNEFKYNRLQFEEHAKEWTRKHAMPSSKRKSDASEETVPSKKCVEEHSEYFSTNGPLFDVTNKK